jgi:CHAT domain-containing protein
MNQAMVLGNLSLAHQRLGNWKAAQKTMEDGWKQFKLSTTGYTQTDYVRVEVQLWSAQASLNFALGQPEKALKHWQIAEQINAKLGSDRNSANLENPVKTQNQISVQNQINQVQALQALGQHRRACQLLIQTLTLDSQLCDSGSSEVQHTTRQIQQIREQFQRSPDIQTLVLVLQSMGQVYRQAGHFKAAQEMLEAAQENAEKSKLPTAIGRIKLELGHLAKEQKNSNSTNQDSSKTPLERYQEVETSATPKLTHLQAKVDRLHLLLQGQSPMSETRPEIQALIHDLFRDLNTLPPSYAEIYTQIHLIQTLLKPIDSGKKPEQTSQHLTSTAEPAKQSFYQQNPSLVLESAKFLANTAEASQKLENRKAQSYALGYLGQLYEQNQQCAEARRLTEKALWLAEGIRATEISYRWQWQLGRILKAQGHLNNAIAAYSNAYHHLQSLRKDLVSGNPGMQFSFRDEVEPVYREYVGLLLQSLDGKEPTQDNLKKEQENLETARNVIESLQLAELENFFQACLQPVKLDQVVDHQNPSTAVIYPILLSDRIEVITVFKSAQTRKLQFDRSKPYPIPKHEVEESLKKLKHALRQPDGRSEVQEISRNVYDWLIRPISEKLKQQNIDTLVFVLDGDLRNIPMAVLYNAEKKQYLIESYAVAIAPGLQLIDQPKLLKKISRRALIFAASSFKVPPFGTLPYAVQEANNIKAQLPQSLVILDQEFTKNRLQTLLRTESFPIVHMATHGQFSSNLEKTFILTSEDKPLKLKELNIILRERPSGQANPIELLVLSACETATGDRYATLGLAGVSLRAGVRSTVATLWQIDDGSTAELMSEFYHQLNQPQKQAHFVTKAKALQKAQKKLLSQEEPTDPLRWPAYVLIGNWL